MPQWLADPSTRELLPALASSEASLRRVCGDLVFLGQHDEHAPGWEISEPDDCGFVYARPCRRPCVHRNGPAWARGIVL